MLLVGFEHKVPVFELEKTFHANDSASNVMGCYNTLGGLLICDVLTMLSVIPITYGRIEG
jgi:hypothetical protein